MDSNNVVIKECLSLSSENKIKKYKYPYKYNYIEVFISVKSLKFINQLILIDFLFK